jgi:predicted MFS family arabinose efflux permease
MSGAQIAALFGVWTMTSVIAQVPCGALADRFSRRGALAVSGVLQAAAYALWMIAPVFSGFAAGFVLWGIGGALVAGAFPALVHDALAAADADHRLGAVLGRAEAAALVVQIPLAGIAVVLMHGGGFAPVAVASILTCLTAALVALTLPERRPHRGHRSPVGYLETLRSGARVASGAAAVRGLVLATGVIAAFEAIEEFTPVMAHDWGVASSAVPAALLVVPLAGACGAAAGGRLARAGRRAVGGWALGAALCLCGALAVARPVAIIALAAFYGAWMALSVAAEVRLQRAIDGEARATTTSFAGLTAELAALPVLAAWAAGGAALVAPLAVVGAAALPWLVGPPERADA